MSDLRSGLEQVLDEWRQFAVEAFYPERRAVLTECADRVAALLLEPKESKPDPRAADPRLLQQLRAWLDTLIIHGDNIGDIRRACFMPWDCEWNGIVRDETAQREQSTPGLRGDALPPPPQEK
jgi:hypothetical protein